MSFDFWIGFLLGFIFPGAVFLAGLIYGWFKYVVKSTDKEAASQRDMHIALIKMGEELRRAGAARHN